MAKKVQLLVDAFGKTEISAEGYSGGTCVDATRAFEEMFSETVRERQAQGDCQRRDDGERVRT